MQTSTQITLHLTERECDILRRALTEAGDTALAERLAVSTPPTVTPPQVNQIARLRDQGPVGRPRRLVLTSYILQTKEQGAPGGPTLYHD
jgi:hypothetical protein